MPRRMRVFGGTPSSKWLGVLIIGIKPTPVRVMKQQLAAVSTMKFWNPPNRQSPPKNPVPTGPIAGRKTRRTPRFDGSAPPPAGDRTHGVWPAGPRSDRRCEENEMPDAFAEVVRRLRVSEETEADRQQAGCEHEPPGGAVIGLPGFADRDRPRFAGGGRWRAAPRIGRADFGVVSHCCSLLSALITAALEGSKPCRRRIRRCIRSCSSVRR